MGEKGTRVSDQRTGAYIATRDAVETDDQGHPRTVQLVDFSSRRVLFQKNRGYPDAVVSVDDPNLFTLAEELVTHLIPVGDKTILLVSPFHTDVNGEVHVTPILFATKTTTTSTSTSSTSSSSTSSSSTTTTSTTMTGSTSTTLPYEVIGVLATKGSAMGTVAFKLGGGDYVSPELSWDVMGAEFVGLHVSYLSGSNGVRLQSGVI
jgi:uncharacterized membrane protein